jgi:hypothetical protein
MTPINLNMSDINSDGYHATSSAFISDFLSRFQLTYLPAKSLTSSISLHVLALLRTWLGNVLYHIHTLDSCLFVYIYSSTSKPLAVKNALLAAAALAIPVHLDTDATELEKCCRLQISTVLTSVCAWFVE